MFQENRKPPLKDVLNLHLQFGQRSLAAMACSLVGALYAAEGGGNEPEPRKPDKSRYHLFHPTPAGSLREMSTDRPDKTESAFTVDAGHFQLEMDLLNYARDRDSSGGGDVRTEAYAIAPVNLKLGLLNTVDIQVLLDTYNHVRQHDRVARTVEKRSGFGDVTTRLKANFWGNDEGATALAIMPWVKFPSNQDGLGNHAVEAGIIFPFAAELPRGWSLGAMTEFDFLRNEANTGYDTTFVNSITFSHGIYRELGGYVEFFSEVSTGSDSRWVGTVDLGLTYGLTDNIQLDAGVNLGVTRSADDVNPFVGISWRF